jgi:hypothetical protein
LIYHSKTLELLSKTAMAMLGRCYACVIWS